ncbi:MAG: winged helix-turn-helix domain-containing protein, partial [Oscillospiraceae bacterium]
EFAILEYFLLNKNKVISQEELIEHIWDNNADSFSGAIRVHIASLRKKLKSVLYYDPIETKFGKGYCLLDGDENNA